MGVMATKQATKTLIRGGWKNPTMRARVPSSKAGEAPPRIHGLPGPCEQVARLVSHDGERLVPIADRVFGLCAGCGAWMSETTESGTRTVPTRTALLESRCVCPDRNGRE